MRSVMHYGHYTAQIEYDETSDLFHGRVLGIRDVVEFYGKTTKDLHREFKISVDDYLKMCAEEGVPPEKPFTGKFTLRVDGEDHRQFVMVAALQKQSLNAWARDVLRDAAYRRMN